MLRSLFASLAVLAVLSLAACDCGDDPAPPGAPYHCPGMAMDGGGAPTICRAGEACVERSGTMPGFSCAPDVGCPANVAAAYCPGASAFCGSDVPFPLVNAADGGPATVTQTRVLCRF